MKRLFVFIVLMFALVGCTSNAEEKDNVLPDGNVSEEEAQILQESWCDYNKDKDFAKYQCEEYWND